MWNLVTESTPKSGALVVARCKNPYGEHDLMNLMYEDGVWKLPNGMSYILGEPVGWRYCNLQKGN